MLFPYKDTNPTRRFSVVTFLIIAANIFVFLYQHLSGIGYEYSTRQFALIPVELFKGNLPDSTLVSPLVSSFTYMFLHGGLLHLVFNMIFLWIFGNNIEDVMTRPRFLFFYLLTGLISGLAYAVMSPNGEIPLVGASGAISAVLGAYLFLFPWARVHVLVFIFPVQMPALIFLVLWFAAQISGFMDGQGNVAWISHIAGFISGVVLHRFYIVRRR
ncbi:MAG: rhomboid family intramembrane serine protease [Spirochaetae bacterium HGW-Spirochaetae-1]|jgi:membrane associated rhomboid family serine protease|nr:MAG: rhomboid family intramembrane serine protease [Spirochaetae bacterium HGW-Spirochaetae-1]